MIYNSSFHTRSLKNLSFLVTGGAGFIGSNIVEYLLQYDAGKVKVLDNLSTGSLSNISSFNKKLNFEFIEGDICDLRSCQKACANINFVLHQAALGSVPRSIKDPSATNNTNITGFLNMLIAARDQKVERFIYAASSSTYGDSQLSPKIEDKIGKPLSPYAVTKLVNELYADVFANLYGIKTIGLRYFNVFGPNQSPAGGYAAVIPKFINALLNNLQIVIYGDGEQTRDFTFIENAVEANIRAMFVQDKNALNQIYNVAVGECISVNEVFNILKKTFNNGLIPIYESERAGEVKNSLADISKAKKLLGYDPKVKTKEGLKKTLDWFRNNGVHQ